MRMQAGSEGWAPFVCGSLHVRLGALKTKCAVWLSAGGRERGSARRQERGTARCAAVSKIAELMRTLDATQTVFDACFMFGHDEACSGVKVTQ